MSLDARTAKELLTPEERRAHLRALADRMLLKTAARDDPEDLPGVERTVRVTAGIERIYSRCDRAEKHAPDPRKLEAERATNHSNALKARVALASDLEWGEQRRKDLGAWWDAADTSDQPAKPAAAPKPELQKPVAPTPVTSPAAQGAMLRQRLAAAHDKTLDTLFDKTPQSASEVLASSTRLLKACAAIERGDITEDEIHDFDEELDDWIQGRTAPSG